MKLTAFIAAALLGTTAVAQTAEPPKPAEPAAKPPEAPAKPAEPPKQSWTFAFHGFFSMSAAYQLGAFGLSEGQGSLFATTGQNAKDKESLTFDVRQTRLNFSVKGPQVLFGATPSGVVELDFFQGFGGGNSGDVNLLNRLRFAYSELNWGNHKLWFGQQNDLTFAMAPTSLSHIAQPLGFMTGNIGWRRPGIFGFHTFNLPGVTLEGAWEVGRGQWADSAGCVVSTIPTTTDKGCSGIGGGAVGTAGGINWAEASAGPAVQARLTAIFGKLANVWVAGHFNQVDLSGYGSGASSAGGDTPRTTIPVRVANGGAKIVYPLPFNMGVTLAATGYWGQNVWPLVAGMSGGTQPVAGTSSASLPAGWGTFKLGYLGENMAMWGYWAQGGFNFTKELSVWGFYGEGHVNEKDYVRSLGTGAAAGPDLGATGIPFKTATTNVILMYRDGGYGLSFEWLDFATKYGKVTDFVAGGPLPGTKFTTVRTSHADQYMLTATYFF